MSFGVRASFRESALARELAAARLAAFGSVLGNAFLKFEAASDFVSDLSSRLFSGIPYAREANGGERVKTGRQAFIEQFWKMHRKLHGKQDGGSRKDG